MINSSGFTSLVALKLQRDCFVDEQDRLAEYAKSLRVPVQTGEVIKGDTGEKGEKGDRGNSGGRGADGVDGNTPTLTEQIEEIASGVDFHTISGDVRNRTINLYYDDLALVPASWVNIMGLRYDGTDTIVYLNAVTPDDKFRLRLITFL